MNKDLRIPEIERYKFSQPLGKLIAGTREETIALIERELKQLEFDHLDIRVYLVGDIVTHDFLNNEFLRRFIKLCIVDEKTQRNHIKIASEAFFELIIEFENPKGEIKKESFQVLKQIVQGSKRTLLKITVGEEDLLVLPLVSVLNLEVSTMHLVFYGQPPITDSKKPIPEGIVMVKVDNKIQKTVDKFLKVMQKF